MVCFASLEIWGEVSIEDTDLKILGKQMKYKARSLAEITCRLFAIDKMRGLRIEWG